MKVLLLLTLLTSLHAISPLMSFGQDQNSYHYKDKIVLKSNNKVLRGQIIDYGQDTLMMEFPGGSSAKFLTSQLKKVIQHFPKLSKISALKNPDKRNIFTISHALGVGDLESGDNFGQELGFLYKYNTHKGIVFMGGIGWDNYLRSQSLNYMPVLLGYEIHIPVKMKSSLYLSVLSGYSVPVTLKSNRLHSHQGGMFLNPAIGILFASGGKMGFFMEMGAKVQQVSYQTWIGDSGTNTTYERFLMRFGMVF